MTGLPAEFPLGAAAPDAFPPVPAAHSGAGLRADRRLAIAETRSLGNRQYLVVAAYDGRKFLLGVCPGRIEMLAPLDGGSPPLP